MAVVIRLTRRGRMHAPFYRIGVFDSRCRRDGAAIESLGYYNPIARGQDTPLKLDAERTKYWLSVGAKPSETVRSFFKKVGIEYDPMAPRTARNAKRATKRPAKKAGATSKRKAKKKQEA